MTEHSAAEIRRTRLRGLVRKGRVVLWWTGSAVLLTALLFVMLWKVPKWQVARVNRLDSIQQFDRENEARKTLATILGGIVVLAGGFATWRSLKLAQESLRVSQEGQITDRFTKAIEQLGAVDASGKKKLEVRLGGIYALERIANQSERDHWPIMEVLSTYVRENARCKPQEESQENQASDEPTPLAADIQAILTVLGRRNTKNERGMQNLDLAETDLVMAKLSRANLSGANLRRAFLKAADLIMANLSEAELAMANLSRANLGHANLSRAFLHGADLDEAFLGRANLSGAFLNGAHLNGASLGLANLSGADLSDADLSKAKRLSQEQVDAAIGNSATQLPENLHMPESWIK